ncbi:serine hydrolase domain-containing protein [Maridesulfovibrio salexigens]|uniref:Beta-lactamase n=1 Tax=Maridesulfovibrio salexigens (strain ATCC 14822 / DSM 2638 / NCIMB 8403 / VKM B-1763) TaxID=526222 RepID=C6C1L5_MARSD|nr:serine hydrolase domain-containing protein [Maridesulfovibrio salexigens]ACS81190.1 beta-lactamase [Maridesulfovibrio salexigens DSM 2638]
MQQRTQRFFIQIISILLLLSCPLTLGNTGCGTGLEFPEEQAKALQASLDQSRSNLGFPGGMIGVRQVGGATWMGVSGNANLNGNVAYIDDNIIFKIQNLLITPAYAAGTPVPMNTNMYMRIGSVTKTYTAALIMKLAEEGKLNLDDKVDDWMGAGYYPNSNIATIRQLLNMTSGFTNYTQTPDYFAQYTATPKATFQPETLVNYARTCGKPYISLPGTGWHYSNTNYAILGLIAEKAGEADFKTLIQEKILDKLYLQMTYVPAIDDNTIRSPYVNGYEKQGGSWVDTTDHSPSVAFSAGNIVSSLSNMLNWIEALHEYQLLTKESVDQMMTLVAMSDGSPWSGEIFGYGLGIMYNKGATGHNGDIDGYKVCLYKYKDHYFAVAINTDTAPAGDAEAVFWDAVRTLYPEDNI